MDFIFDIWIVTILYADTNIFSDVIYTVSCKKPLETITTFVLSVFVKYLK